MANILVVDDEPKMRHLLSLMLERRNHKADQAGDGLQALKMIKEKPYDMVITDIKMPKLDGMGLLKEMKSWDIPCPVIFITAFATVDSAVTAMQAGAVDFITKPFEEDRILLTVERTLRMSLILAENKDLRQALNLTVGPDKMVYISKPMTVAMDLASKVAQSDSAVLITGESGTGKELLAKYIHFSSTRSKMKFVPVNCAAISPSLVESELFGHEKGAFTGADRQKQGKFEYASKGTLFMDEIGDLPLEAQAKLLRALQEKKIQRVGGNAEVDIDVRVVCATNRKLTELVEREEFRQDLYFRINVFPIHMPPLRERKEDILPLVEHFLNRLGEGKKLHITDGALRILNEYQWPGNVRELVNVVERGAILAGYQGSITSETLSFLKRESEANHCENEFKLPPEGISLEELQRNMVKQALAASGSNQTLAAKLLGLTRAKFRVLMKQIEITE